MCMDVCLRVWAPHSCSAYWDQNSIRSPGTGVIHGCEQPPWECWDFSPGPLEEQHLVAELALAWLVLVWGLSGNFFLFLGRVSFCSLGWPGAHSTDEASLESTKTDLPLPPSSGIKLCVTKTNPFYTHESTCDPMVTPNTIKKQNKKNLWEWGSK